jgi:phosphoribosylanthranilate isomerase
MNHPQIKICGLTCPDEAVKCAELGADAIGLVFFAKSPRNVSEETAAAITRALPDHVVPTGVFVNESYEFIMNKVDRCGLKAVQLHGNEQPELVNRLKAQNLTVIKVLYMKSEPDISQAGLFDPAAFLVEYATGAIPGGNALSWDVENVTVLETEKPLIIAGGLSPDTIRSAVLAARPDGVDVSSGVEKKPGQKDLSKVEAFIKAVRSCDLDKNLRRIFS